MIAQYWLTKQEKSAPINKIIAHRKKELNPLTRIAPFSFKIAKQIEKTKKNMPKVKHATTPTFIVYTTFKISFFKIRFIIKYNIKLE